MDVRFACAGIVGLRACASTTASHAQVCLTDDCRSTEVSGVHWKPAIYTVDSIRAGPRPTVDLQQQQRPLLQSGAAGTGGLLAAGTILSDAVLSKLRAPPDWILGLFPLLVRQRRTPSRLVGRLGKTGDECAETQVPPVLYRKHTTRRTPLTQDRGCRHTTRRC